MWFVCFCFLLDTWRRTPKLYTQRQSAGNAAVVFSFFSIAVFVSCQLLKLTQFLAIFVWVSGLFTPLLFHPLADLPLAHSPSGLFAPGANKPGVDLRVAAIQKRDST